MTAHVTTQPLLRRHSSPQTPSEALAAFVAAGRRETLIGELSRKWHTLGRTEVEDAVDHAIAEAAEALRATREAAVYDYLRTAAQRALGRRKERAGRISAPVATELDFDRLVGDTLTPEDALLAKEHRQLVLDLVAGLDDRTLAVMRLKHVEGLERKAVADALGISEKAVKKAIEKGLRLCREAFEAAMAGELCESRSRALHAVAMGTAGVRERREAEQHLAHCHACRDMQRAMGATQRAAAALVPAPLVGVVGAGHGIEWLRRAAEAVRSKASGFAAHSAVAGKAAAVAATAAIAGTAIGLVPHGDAADPPAVEKSKPAHVVGTVQATPELKPRWTPAATKPAVKRGASRERTRHSPAASASTARTAGTPVAPAPTSPGLTTSAAATSDPSARPTARLGEFPVL